MQIMLAPVKLYSELIIKVSIPFMPLSHTLNTAVGGAEFLKLDKTKIKKGAIWRQRQKETRYAWRKRLCPALMEVFALW